MKTRWSMFPGGPKSKIASKLTTGDRIIRYGHERRRMETKLQRTPIRQRRMLEVGGIAKECTMLLHLINNNLFSKALASAKDAKADAKFLAVAPRDQNVGPGNSVATVVWTTLPIQCCHGVMLRFMVVMVFITLSWFAHGVSRLSWCCKFAFAYLFTCSSFPILVPWFR